MEKELDAVSQVAPSRSGSLAERLSSAASNIVGGRKRSVVGIDNEILPKIIEAP